MISVQSDENACENALIIITDLGNCSKYPFRYVLARGNPAETQERCREKINLLQVR
jgi:hypothetical protein